MTGCWVGKQKDDLEASTPTQVWRAWIYSCADLLGRVALPPPPPSRVQQFKQGICTWVDENFIRVPFWGNMKLISRTICLLSSGQMLYSFFLKCRTSQMTGLRAVDCLVYEFDICTGIVTNSRGPPAGRIDCWGPPLINNRLVQNETLNGLLSSLVSHVPFTNLYCLSLVAPQELLHCVKK